MVPCNKDADTYLDKVLESALHHGRREKRREMIYILGELRDSRALNTLKAIMAEDDPYLVWEAVAAAAKIGGPAAIEQLQIMMRHPSFMVRGEVALALGKMDHPTRDEILNQLRADNSPYVANCACIALNYNNVNLNEKDMQKRRFYRAKRCDKSR